jgi:hypothetical protein
LIKVSLFGMDSLHTWTEEISGKSFMIMQDTTSGRDIPAILT